MSWGKMCKVSEISGPKKIGLFGRPKALRSMKTPCRAKDTHCQLFSLQNLEQSCDQICSVGHDLLHQDAWQRGFVTHENPRLGVHLILSVGTSLKLHHRVPSIRGTGLVQKQFFLRRASQKERKGCPSTVGTVPSLFPFSSP